MTRKFSTREVAQMWNVSESTVKRWADSRDLRCQRTPGGHRRFTMADIQSFQVSQGFEANGLLTTENWEDPSLETSLNKKDFEEVSEQVFYLACNNQLNNLRELLVRLLLRGVDLAEIFDRVLEPVVERCRASVNHQELAGGQKSLIRNNLEEAIYSASPSLVKRQPNGKLSLCAAPDSTRCLALKAVSQVLEVEGWECLNLGCEVSFKSMAEMVRLEPVNLVCVISDKPVDPLPYQEIASLAEATQDYRIPLVFFGRGFACLSEHEEYRHDYYPRLKSFQSYLGTLTRF